MSEEEKIGKPKAEAPYVVGQWDGEGKFWPATKQPKAPITDFDEIVVWAKENLNEVAADWSFVKRMPRTLRMIEQKTIKGTLV